MTRQTNPADSTTLKKPPALTNGEQCLLYLTVALLLAVGTIGLIASFQSVTAAATRWGFQTPELLPIAIDLAIPGFTIAHLLLIRMDMELAWVRAVPMALTAVTVYLNVQAAANPLTPLGHAALPAKADSTLAAQIGHGALPLVWVVCSEIAGHVYRVIIGAATGKRMERIRRARFALAPIKTSALWRRMVLWEETSYTSALSRERERLLARASLRERYGWLWWFRAPIRERALLHLGELAPAFDGERPAEGERLSVSAEPERAGLSVTERPALTSPAHPPLTPPQPQVTVGMSAPVSAPAPAPVSADSDSQPERAQSAVTLTKRARPAAHARTSASTVRALGDARSALIVPLYKALNRRPEWTEIRDALIDAGHDAVSRPTAQRIRERAEQHNPELTKYPSAAQPGGAQRSGTDD
ncbi:DUF2637 domain-containing protein [Kitasatospora sp. NPDC048545]|uniref:DUF2637 domain-containing protein n=1 Tax=Kitasatospora sp. NPDC048545 TaxID=3157208 RepID=UPI0033D4CAB1